jgi:purine catabolism regulator
MAGAERLVGRVLHAVAGDKGGGRRSFSVGVSRLAPDLTGLPEAYAHARRALEVGRRVHGSGSTTWYDELGLHRLLAMIPDTAELDAFVHDVLGELADDTDEATALRETLQVLLDTNFNVAEAARAQFFHYNTMRYRVGKLERMLGPVSNDPDLRLDVAVALKAREVIGH